MTFSTADLWDAHPGVLTSLGLPWRNFGGRSSFWGAVRTVRTRTDVGGIRAVLEEPGNGKVMLVDADGELGHAMFGDRMAAIALHNGWAGVLVIGAVRDTAALAALDLGVKALGTSAKRPVLTASPARVGLALEFEIALHDGDYIYCDDDDVLFGGRKLLG